MVRCRRPRVRHPLREHRHDVLALGRERRVEHRRDADVGERERGGPARDRVLERAFDVVERFGEHDRAAVHLGVEARACAVNSGSRSTATLTFTVPLRVFQRSMRSTKSVGSSRALDLFEERDLRVRRRDDDVGAQLLARLERHAAHAAVAHVDARDRRVGAHGRAVRDRGASRSACADAAHAAFGEAPRSELAVADVADLVVRHHVRGARRARPGPRADHAAHREHALHLRRREALVEQVGDAHREQARDVADAADVEPAQRPRERAWSARSRGRREPDARRDRRRAAGRARRRARRATRPSARTRRRRPSRTARSARAGARGRCRGAGARGRRGTARSSRAAGTPCSRAARARARARSSAASGSRRTRAR